MKNLKIIIFIAIALVLATYGTYYYIFTNLQWKLSGFSIQPKTTTDSDIQAVNTVADRISVQIEITNNSSISLKIRNFKLKVLNAKGEAVGFIETIRAIDVPRNSKSIVNVNIDNINELSILADTLSGNINNYKYRVSGLLAGVLPIVYKAKLI